jgi:hypothetical protein
LPTPAPAPRPAPPRLPTPPQGYRLLAPDGAGARAAAARAALSAAAGALDFVLLEVFERDRAALWGALKNPCFKGPVLLLYRWGGKAAAGGRGQGRASRPRCPSW